MSDLISREYMKSLGATCIAQRLKDGTLFPIVAIDELPPADLTHPTPSKALGALDCVDRQKAIDESYQVVIDGDVFDVVQVETLMGLPSVQPERKRGKWRRRLVDSGFNADWHCSECGWKTSLEEHGYNFCPNCGCRMEEGDSE